MDTSVGMRLFVIALIFAAAMAIVYANLRILIFFALRKRVGRAARIIWPALAVLLALSIVDAIYLEPNLVTVRRHTILTSKIPHGSHIRTAQISDLHIEGITQREVKMLTFLDREKPDIIVLTGDYCNDKTLENTEALRQVAIRLNRVAPTYAVDGNWDIPGEMSALRKGGAHVLEKWTEISVRRAKIALGPMPWPSQEDMAPPPDRVKGLYKVVLCHMPFKFEESARAGADITLTGHTHGGQIRLPIFGALMPDRQLVGKYQAGMYEYDGKLLYVNRGLGMEGGYAPRVRFCCRPEVAVFDVVGEAAAGGR